MKKLLLVIGVLMGLVSTSYALQFSSSSNKTILQAPLVSSVSNGNAAFITGSTTTSVTNGGQYCLSGGATSFTGTTQGTLMGCDVNAITALSLSGGASGGTVAVYDAMTNGINQANPGEVGVAECVFEATVGANTQNYYDLSNAPIQTLNGVVAYATSTSGVIVYSSKNGKINN